MFPTPHKVQRIRRTRTGENAVGQPVYAESTDVIPVYGWYGWQPTGAAERNTAQLAGRIIDHLWLLSPTDDFRSGDAVLIDGDVYEVDGEGANYNNGPFGFAPGVTVSLRLVANA